MHLVLFTEGETYVQTIQEAFADTFSVSRTKYAATSQELFLTFVFDQTK
jgi:hypothetical protein